MRLDEGRESSNVLDRRDQVSSGGGRGGLPLMGGKLGIGSIAIALVAAYFLGSNPLTVLSLLSGGDGGGATMVQQGPAKAPPRDDAGARLVSVVLADTEDVWKELFAKTGRQYAEPKLVLFRAATPTACGTGQSAMGPFYCLGDRKVYSDLAFYEEMKTRFNAPGDFAQAYVIAHEVGHHVQNLLGIADKVDQARRKVSEREANALSVRLELQADCWPACGRSMPIARVVFWKAAILKRRCRRQARSATTPCSAAPAAVSARIRSPTVRRSSACAGSGKASKVAR